VVMELEGLWLKTEEIEINKRLKVRRPQPKDFEFMSPYEFLPLMERTLRHSSAIIEITQRVKFQPYVWDELEKLVIALRLYKKGSINTVKTIWNPKSILTSGSTSVPHIIRPIVYRYPLLPDDFEKLQSYINKIKPLLPVVQGKIETTDHISIALQRYNESLFMPDSTERLTYAIMGLEALFLKSKEHEELAHRLAQRVAKCLSILGHQSLEVYRIIKESYSVRSQFIHGSLVEGEHDDVSQLADRILEYLRSSVLMFFELKGKMEKESLLNTVDNSLLHGDALAKLEKLIKEQCQITQSISAASPA